VAKTLHSAHLNSWRIVRRSPPNWKTLSKV